MIYFCNCKFKWKDECQENNFFQERRKNIINKYNQQSQQETKIQTQKNCSAQQDKDLYSV